jgi:anti-sigma regulatory factor (Ser/Thr protein kinase)
MVQARHLIDDETKIGEARRQATHLAQCCGLNESAAGRIAIASTELATNLWRHAGGGELLLQPVPHHGAYLIELLAIDRGRGMANVERCMSDGYSTGGTAGTGLGAVRRMAVEFDIYSVAGEGTLVMARIGQDARPSAPAAARFGAISVAVAGESECGDSWRLATGGNMTSLLVVDGLGHGTFAAQAARCVTVAFENGPLDSPREVLERAHRAAAGSRGAGAACARIGAEGQVTYAGIGNIGGCLLSHEGSQGLVSHAGTLGLRVSRMHQFDYRRTPRALLIMHSDGLSARWDLKSKAGPLQRHPAIIAAMLYRDYGRGRDDATVVVLN